MTCSQSGDALELRDTRRVAAFAHALLTGIRRDVIEYCDRAHTLEQIHDRLIREKDTEVPKDEIKAILDEFVGDNLMVREGSWYLSLPIMKHLE